MTRASDTAKLLGAGATINDGTTITTDDNTTQLTLKSTDTDSGVGPILSLSRDNDSAADDDLVGQIHFFAEHDGNSQHKYSEIFCQIADASDGSEDGRLYFNVSDGGSNREFMRMTGSEGIVINEEGEADLDFRVESDGNANMINVDSGNNIVGIGRVPDSNDGGAGSLQLEGNDGIAFRRNGQTNSFIIRPLSSGDGIRFTQGGTGDRVTIGSSGDLLATATIGGAGSYSNTTSGGANVHILSSGVLVRSTSSLKYKNTINDATHGLTELLKLRPVTYKGNNDGDTVFGGLIAEEVHDSGLTEFVQYNEDNEPDALAYGNMVSLCIKAIQELKTELDNAKARITELESK